MLVNGIYFKGDWKEKFDPRNTVKAPFHVSETQTEQVEMMNMETKVPYAELPTLDATAIALPYKVSFIQNTIVTVKYSCFTIFVFIIG